MQGQQPGPGLYVWEREEGPLELKEAHLQMCYFWVLALHVLRSFSDVLIPRWLELIETLTSLDSGFLPRISLKR